MNISRVIPLTGRIGVAYVNGLQGNDPHYPINGVPSNINPLLLTAILKHQWGFQGFVVSDLGGVETMIKGHLKGEMTYEDAVAQSLIAGCDFSDREFETYLPVAVRKGLLFWDMKTHGWVVEAGAFEVLVGSSSEDIRVHGQFEVR